jgi:hypothetical protein
MIRRLSSSKGQARPGIRVSDRSLTAVVLALGVLVLAGLILLLGRKGYDDPYITFRYASNLLAGNGFVYNVGQRVLSTTAPFYAFLLAGVGLVWPDLPAAGNFLSALSLVLSAALLLAWARGRGETGVGMIAALLLSLSPFVLLTFGSEICLYIMLVLAGFYAYDRSQTVLAAGALALAAMVRPDGVLAAAALVLVHLASRRSVPWRAVILYATALVVWFGGLWLYFGSPLPVTLQVKQLQGQMAISDPFGAGLWNAVRAYGRLPLYWLHGLLALMGLGRVVLRARYWLPLLVWTGLYLLAYTLLGVSSYFWYYVPLVPAFVVLTAEGSMVVLRGLARARLSRLAMTACTGLLVLALLTPLLVGITSVGWRTDTRLEVYRQVGHWLADHTPLQATVGTLEVGIIGYHAQRTMVGFAGLIQPDVARQLAVSTTYQDSATWAIQTYRPDYVALPGGTFDAIAGSDWFRASYEFVRDFAGSGTLWMKLYRRSATP